jgi:hypothetical protein
MIIKRIAGTVLAACVLMGSMSVTPVSAATANTSGCPTSSNGTGDELKAPSSKQLLQREVVEGMVVASNDADAATEIVCVKTKRKGSYATLNPDGTVYYMASKRNDLITVGATNGSSYYSTTVQISVEKVKNASLKVIKKNNQRAIVKFTNPNKQRMIEIWAGTYSQPEPDVIFQLEAGESKRYVTRRAQLDWSTAVYNSNEELFFISNNSKRLRGPKQAYRSQLNDNPSATPWS